MSMDKNLLDELMKGRSASDLFGKDGVLAELTKALAERALSAELDDHLTEERAEPPAEGASQAPNRRNGSSQKTVTTDSGKVVLDIPRDRNGSFDPVLIAKYQRRFPEFDTKIISMYARGMTTREIQGHIEEIYGIEASPSLISAVTDAVMEEVTAWQNRPLEPCYPVVFMDAIRVNIRSDGAVSNKAVFVALAILPDGTRDVLGLWFQANEGAKFWAKVLNDLRNRGVQDILIAVVDGLKGFPQAIEAAFPQTQVQTCIVHLLRHSMSFARFKRQEIDPGDQSPRRTGPQGRGCGAQGSLHGRRRGSRRNRAGGVRGQRSGCPLPGNCAELAPGLGRGDPVPRLSARGPQTDLHDECHRGAELEDPPGRPHKGALPQRRGGGEIDLSGAECYLSGVEAISPRMARREEPVRHNVRGSVPNGVIKAPGHRIPDSLDYNS